MIVNVRGDQRRRRQTANQNRKRSVKTMRGLKKDTTRNDKSESTVFIADDLCLFFVCARKNQRACEWQMRPPPLRPQCTLAMYERSFDRNGALYPRPQLRADSARHALSGGKREIFHAGTAKRLPASSPIVSPTHMHVARDIASNRVVARPSSLTGSTPCFVNMCAVVCVA